MKDALLHIDRLIDLLGKMRSDKNVDTFINQFDPPPIITIEKDDGPDDEFVEFKESGFGFHFMKDKLVCIHFHSEIDCTDYAIYKHPLPMGICFEQSKSELVNMFGKPDAEGGGNKSDFFGEIPVWLKYRKNKYTIQIQFTDKCEGIGVVSVMNYG